MKLIKTTMGFIVAMTALLIVAVQLGTFDKLMAWRAQPQTTNLNVILDAGGGQTQPEVMVLEAAAPAAVPVPPTVNTVGNAPQSVNVPQTTNVSPAVVKTPGYDATRGVYYFSPGANYDLPDDAIVNPFYGLSDGPSGADIVNSVFLDQCEENYALVGEYQNFKCEERLQAAGRLTAAPTD